MEGWQWVGSQPQIQRYSFVWHLQNIYKHLYLHFPPLNLFLHSTKGQEHVSPPPTAFYHQSFSSILRERENWPPAYFPFSQDDKKDERTRTDRPTEETMEAGPLAPTSSATVSLVILCSIKCTFIISLDRCDCTFFAPSAAIFD